MGKYDAIVQHQVFNVTNYFAPLQNQV